MLQELAPAGPPMASAVYVPSGLRLHGREPSGRSLREPPKVSLQPARFVDWHSNLEDILCTMRVFSLLFALIALVVLAVFLIYVIRGPVDPLIAGGIFISFLACLVPALLLLKPFEPPEALRRRREEARKERERRRRSAGGPPRDPGS